MSYRFVHVQTFFFFILTKDEHKE